MTVSVAVEGSPMSSLLMQGDIEELSRCKTIKDNLRNFAENVEQLRSFRV